MRVYFKNLSNENRRIIREKLDSNYLSVKDVTIHLDNNRFTVVVKKGVDSLLKEFQFNNQDND